MKLKLLPILSAFLFCSHIGFSQKTELGLGLGTLSYSGDLYRGYNLLNQKPGIQGYYRVNYDKDVSFRFSALFGAVAGDDTRPFDALGESRNRDFNRTLVELSATMEFHFLDYKNPRSSIRWSPYVFGGVGVVRFLNPGENLNQTQPVVPFGLGFKHLLGKQYSMGLEFGARKTFTDHLDGVSDGEFFEKTDFQFGNPEDKDWYYFVGISISYIIYKIPCTYKYEPNKSLRRQ